MKFLNITPIHEMNGVFIKREDLAYWQSLEYPSGSKVRQYLDMAHKSVQREGFPPCLVGCSANSAMQIYVAAAAKQLKTVGIICIPKRKIKTDATKYAERMGADIHEIKPGYLSVVRKAARQIQIDQQRVVLWDRKAAIEDTIDQCVNIPENIKRIIVPTGSGLTAAGVLLGTRNIEVVAVCTSPMANKAEIMRLAHRINKDISPLWLTVLPPDIPYDTPIVERLPDGTPLDPFYAAKAWKHVKQGRGHLLWPPGLRPIISMPEVCQKEFKDWGGPQ